MKMEVHQKDRESQAIMATYLEGILLKAEVVVLWMIPEALKSTASEEMKKASPRDHVLLPLLKSTYEDRRAYIEFDSEADVRSTLEVYPALYRPAAVC